jgi:surfactin synthase thioesterase subunit
VVVSFTTGIVWPAPRPQAEQVLVCLSFCGGGTVAFRPWADTLSQDFDLALVCYPGRERRFNEPMAGSWSELMDDVLVSIRSLAHRPYVLFGHSMGAWVAFEVTAAAERGGFQAPQALVVSASSPPSRAAQEELEPPNANDSDEVLLDWMRGVGQVSELVMEDPGLRAYALELFRADKRVTSSYEFTAGRSVRTPMKVLSGLDDPHVCDIDGWRALAAGDCRFDELAGGHFYTPEIWAQMPSRIVALTA